MSNTKTTKADYSRKVVVMRDGERVEVALTEVDIPDLWHVAKAAGDALDRLAAIQRAVDLDVPASEQVGTIQDLLNGSAEAPETQDGKRISDTIRAAWHTAHALKKNLAGDVT